MAHNNAGLLLRNYLGKGFLQRLFLLTGTYFHLYICLQKFVQELLLKAATL
jgi:hypothetical protein